MGYNAIAMGYNANLKCLFYFFYQSPYLAVRGFDLWEDRHNWTDQVKESHVRQILKASFDY